MSHLTLYTLPTLILFLFPPTSSSVVKKVDIKSIDYCKHKCFNRDAKGNIVDGTDSTVCHCLRKLTHREELQDLVEFRTFILNTHNKLRNMLAGGKVKHKSGAFYPQASNMRAISYSEELEYSARCWAVQVYEYHDKCRATSQFENVGQNLHFHSDNMFPFEISMWGWWSEYDKYSPDLIGKFQIPPGRSGNDVGHFVQIAWAQTYQVGCARSYNPFNNKSSGVFHYASMCNYGTFGFGSNIMTYPIYNSTGSPCSQCQAEYQLSCNKEYPNLCGEIDPVPTDPPVPIKISCEGIDKQLCDDINSGKLDSTAAVNSGKKFSIFTALLVCVLLWN